MDGLKDGWTICLHERAPPCGVKQTNLFVQIVQGVQDLRSKSDNRFLRIERFSLVHVIKQIALRMKATPKMMQGHLITAFQPREIASAGIRNNKAK